MVYRQRNSPSPITNGECPVCKSKRLLYSKGKIICQNCGHEIGPTYNKYGAKKQEFEGKIYDSKFEASVAADLALRKRVGDILDYDTQFRVEADIRSSTGSVICHKRHKVDFRLTNNDGSFTLLEAKGVITSDYQWRRDVVVGIWLDEHKDYTYEVITQEKRRK